MVTKFKFPPKAPSMERNWNTQPKRSLLHHDTAVLVTQGARRIRKARNTLLQEQQVPSHAYPNSIRLNGRLRQVIALSVR